MSTLHVAPGPIKSELIQVSAADVDAPTLPNQPHLAAEAVCSTAVEHLAPAAEVSPLLPAAEKPKLLTKRSSTFSGSLRPEDMDMKRTSGSSPGFREQVTQARKMRASAAIAIVAEQRFASQKRAVVAEFRLHRRAALAALAVFVAVMVAASRSAPPKPPLGISSSAGGLRAFFGASVLTRATAEIGAWPNVTHFGAVSGSSWLVSQLLGSRALRKRLLDPERPIRAFGVWWVSQYERKVARYLKSDAARGGIFSRTTASRCVDGGTSGGCEASRPLHQAEGDTSCARVMEYLGSAFHLPTADWQAFVQLLLSSDSWEDRLSHWVHMAAARHPTGGRHYYLGMALPPNAWVARSDGGGRGVAPPYCHNRVHAAPGTPDPAVLPLGYRLAGDGSDTAWLVRPDVPLGVQPIADPSHCFGHAPNQSDAPVLRFALPDAPSLSFLAAASSAAAGFLASPFMAAAMFKDRLGPVRSRGVVERIARCSMKLRDEAPDFDDGAFRVVDGAFTDHTGAAWTLSGLIADCLDASSGVDCNARIPTLIVADHRQSSGRGKRSGTLCDLFRPMGLTQRDQPMRAANVYKSGSALTMPTTQVIAEHCPPPWGWKTSPVDPISKAYVRYTHVRASTAENRWYLVPAGHSVNVLLLELINPRAEKLYWHTANFAAQMRHDLVDPMESMVNASATIIREFLDETNAFSGRYPEPEDKGWIAARRALRGVRREMKDLLSSVGL